MPVDYGGDGFGVLRVDEDVVVVEVVVPEVRGGEGCVVWNEGFEDLVVVG